MKSLFTALIASSVLTILLCSSVHANLVLPADSGAVNVKTDLIARGIHTANAAGNGSTDDTAAIQAAINWAIDNNWRYATAKVLYFPNGTYRLTDQIRSRVAADTWSAGWRSGMILMGQSRTGVVLKLDNNLIGFTDTTVPKALISTGSENPTTSSDGSGNQAFRHQIVNLTVDTGSGNIGAIGIEFNASNRGTVRDVTIKTSDSTKRGIVGLRVRKTSDGVGPCLIKNVSIDGFDSGIVAGNYDYSVTFENITLTSQKVRGIFNAASMLTLRNLSSTNSVPVITTSGGDGLINLLDSTFTGGASGSSAITNTGKLLVRGLSSSGYGTVITNQTGNLQNVTGGSGTTTVTEYTSHGVVTLFAETPTSTLGLPVQETPVYSNTNLSTDWANVTAYGATVNSGSDDDSPGIQAAIDSGKPVVYFPNGTYNLKSPILIRNNVRMLIGFESAIRKRSDFSGSQLLRFDSTNTVLLRNLNIFGEVVHNSSGSLAIVHCDITGASYTHTAAGAAGRTFMEDVISTVIRINNGHRFYARQLNCEHNITEFINDGAQAWILGFKTEQQYTAVETKNNGRTEIFGGFFFANTNAASDTPCIITTDSDASISFVVARSQYPLTIRETRSGTTVDRLRSQLPTRGNGSNVVLYTSDGAINQTISLSASADSYIVADPSTTNYGTSTSLLVKYASTASLHRRSLIKFNLASLPQTISQANLILRVSGIGGETVTNRPIQLRAVTNDSWTESGVTWSNQPATGDLLASFTVTASDVGKDLVIDITNFIQQERSGDGTVSLILVQPTSSSALVQFASRESANGPVLEVSSGTSQLSAAADSYVVAGSASTNYGDGTSLLVKYSTTTSQHRRGFLKFDLGSLTQNVNTATLRLHVASVGGETVTNRPIELRAVSSDTWTESGITWSNQPALGSLLASFTVTAADVGTELAIDVTSYLNQELSGDGVVGFALVQPNNSSALVAFSSKESANGPAIEVD